MRLPTNPDNSICKNCPYNRMSLDGLHEDCDPPMGECRLEYDGYMRELRQRQCDPRVVNINGEDVIARHALDEY